MFLVLPPDLHRYIGLLCPEMVPVLSRTCWTLYRNLSCIYNQCSRKILFPKKAVEERWKTKDLNGFAYILRRSDNTMDITYYIIGHVSKSIHIGYNLVSVLIDKFAVIWVSYNYNPDTLDMKTQHYLLSQRAGCIRRNPHYVRETLLTDLDAIYSADIKGTPQVLFCLYAYLYVNVILITEEPPSFRLRAYNRDLSEGKLEETAVREDCRVFYETLRAYYSHEN